MTETTYYKIVQVFTQGWEVTDTKLTKEECSVRLQGYLADGVNPAYLKALIDED
jgi:hypothetical protein